MQVIHIWIAKTLHIYEVRVHTNILSQTGTSQALQTLARETIRKP